MNVRGGRLRAVVLGSMVVAGLTMVACSTGLGGPPSVAEPKPAQPSTQAAPQGPAASPIASPAAVAKSAPAPAASPATGPAPSPVASPSPSPAAVVQAGSAQHGVRLDLEGLRASGSVPKTRPGDQIKLLLKGLPTVFSFQQIGTSRSIRYGDWTQHDIAEMRICVASTEPITPSPTWKPASCELPEAWEPFAPSREVPLEVDWVGPREITAQAQFRRADGTVVQSISSAYQPIEAATAS